MKKQIVKVQLSLYPAGEVMIYNKTQSLLHIESNAPKRLIKLLKRNGHKMFWHYHIEGKQVVLDSVAINQDW